ncbi:MAG: hypothetical protein GX678_00260, partial [Actinomycetales bacterium]|nr:hypothetical protein [Actinomycetales bacterium]
MRLVPSLLALFLGAFATLGFAPARVPGAFFLALIGLVFLLHHESVKTRSKQSVLVSAAFASSLFGIGTWWLNAVSPAAWAGLLLLNVVVFAVMGWALSLTMMLRWWPLWFA